MRIKDIIVSSLMILAAMSAQAQITIGGNVYGGGNEGNVGGNTTVTVRAGDLNKVYGGARMADVGGRAFVNVDGAHASDYMLINYVYGGNDISGTISATDTTVPEELTHKTENNIDNTWNTFVRVSTKTTESGAEAADAKKIYIGQLFGGGNGDYDYTTQSSDNPYYGRTAPNLGKTYLEILGGSIVNAFGGGNMATVTENVVIHLDNPSKVVNHIDVNGTNLLNEARFIKMGINYKFNYPNSDAFQIGNLFGGNNKVDMTIRPKWNLLGGKVRNLYSGGNEGRMTCPQGLLLVIPENSTLKVDNVYGGCRKSDVRPLDALGNDIPNAQIQLADNPTGIPAGFAARTRILGGNVNNVYGGNDISGNVYGGNTVAILTTIHGSVYGGGNGSYAYTDNPALKDELLWRDFYYDPDQVLTSEEKAAVTDNELLSVTALNKVRPNAEQVSLLLRGTAEKPVFVEGSVFVGGNSASLQELTAIPNRQAHVKIGSYVTIDNLFLGNNGENMVKTNAEVRDGDGNLTQTEGVLKTFARTNIASDGTKFNSMVLTDAAVFDKYMEGCAMKLLPSVVFDDIVNYDEYSSQFGSLYCGGNVGSMMTNGLTEISFNDKVIIYDKIVGGCNRANVDATEFNAAYYGGLLGDPDTNGDKLKINFSGLKIQPMRWKDPTDKTKLLEWNTVVYNPTTKQFDNVPNVTPTEADQSITSTDDDKTRRLKGGNIYGGCYESGHVNGNVILNINETLMERDKLFDLTDEGDILYDNTEKEHYTITKRNTGVILSEQGMDVLGDALNVFGAGYGAPSEIWGSTTINLNKGYVFQIFGGGEMGAIGRKKKNGEFDETGEYVYDKAYSTYINLNGEPSLPGVARGATGDSPDMAECEFIYGGAFEGVIAGDTHINLGNGRIFNSFAGSCNADILGHAETYVGRKKKDDGTYEDGGGFPWIRDHIYGGNDLGGSILATNSPNFVGRIRDEVAPMVAETHPVSSYMEYTQGRVRNILGGCFGDYDYTDDAYKNRVAHKPYLHNAFVNFRPNTNPNNAVEKIFGAGEGYTGDRDGDKSQDHSYVLIDIPDNVEKFANTEVFGAGAYNGLGMRTMVAPQANPENPVAYQTSLNEASAIIDLMRGKIGAAYGGSYEEGVTRRTMVNVPAGSTIKIGSIFGGAYGMKILPPCDVYEANVNYQSGDARVNGAIYGGNNNVRRTLYGKVNISAPVLKENGYSGYVYGAGRGQYTWSEYTEVNLESGANVWEVYGGGELGNVLNAESVQKYLQLYSSQPADMVANEDDYWGDPDKWEGGTVGGTLMEAYRAEWKKTWMAAWTIDGYYNPVGEFTRYVGNLYTNLLNPLVTTAAMDDRDLSGFSEEQKARTLKRYNANVIIKEGATVGNYAYGGGYGSSTITLTGGVYGSSYIALLGGTVVKDIYAAGTTGSVCDIFGAGKPGESNSMGFIASANAYIKGGTVRNVYGGGWEGSVGYHVGEINSSTTGDRPGETHVVVGIQEGTSLANGIPVIGRNVYGGGEGGAVFGTAYTTINNGYVGYKWSDGYQENIVDETWKDKDGNFIPNTNLETSGNIFGGGYVDNSSVDITNVKICGGVIRSSVYGGGEIAAIGRGDVYGENESQSGSLKGIYKAGQTHVYVYDGWVKRNVFGGGKGIDNLGRTGTLNTNGYVFGQTDVRIHGGEIGTDEGVAQGYGNVFGGGDIGFVYSAFEYPDGSLGLGKKSGARFDDQDEGYYYKSKGDQFTDNNGTTLTGSANKFMTEDSHVLVEPHCRVTAENSGTEENPGVAVTINGHGYYHGEYVPTSDLNTLKDKTTSSGTWTCLDVDGIIIHNAIFAGGNVSSGSDQVYANATTLYGNATASIHDVYHRDLITVGTGHTGGLYGDGNLTFVDGYRGLNITNYGTDFYHISDDISLSQYDALTPREAAYYELKYKCKKTCTDNEGTTYSEGSTIAQDELIALFAGKTNPTIVYADGTVNSEYWEKNGVVSKYAGRIMNTIQRADFCGVFGSRMVMKGARDRVPEIVDYTNYTINRVREVSLNKKTSVAGDTEEKHKTHGNYFGIYNIVNYLGALTSDVNFYNDVRTTNNTDNAYRTTIEIDNASYEYGSANATYYNWKRAHINDRKRNNGTSHNQVALASGVYLELTTEKSTGVGLKEKDWGYITGVVELDLINVQSGVGGGFVYAKNVHGRRSDSNKTNLILTDMNQGAVTNRSFVYTTDDDTQMEWQSSGNFVHGTQTIIDDCYDVGGKYKGTDKVPAHYWFIKGQVYVYDQYVSAYTGAPNAYSETVNIPLTITAASHGTMKLVNVQPNRYAYYSTYNSSTQKKLEGDNKVVINDVEYHLNDPISYWDWNLLNKSTERNLFVTDTYVVIADCKIGDTPYAEGTVLLKSQYEALMPNGVKPTNVTQKKMVDGVEKNVPVDFDFVFRSSNNLGHDTGYILTYNVNNPTVWNKYYTLNNGTEDDKITIDAYNKLALNAQANYTDGPTYTPVTSGLYGQQEYKVSDIITKEVYDTYQAAKSAHSGAIPADQAVFEKAYLVTSYLETVNKNNVDQRLQEGARLCASDYTTDKWSAMSGSVAEAYVCTSTISLSKTEFIYNGELLTLAKKKQLKEDYKDNVALVADIEKLVVPAYYCSAAGPYGGNYYESGKNYRALEAFSSMSKSDRDKFTFNYDALDLLIDPTYGGTEGQKYQYDGFNSYSAENANKMIYSLERPVDYTAIYNGNEEGLVNGKEYSREEFEALPNEQRHYAPLSVPTAGDYYVVNSPFIIGETPFSVGTMMESSTYASLGDDATRAKVTKLTFTADQVAAGGSTYYYCRESYTGIVPVTASGVAGGVSYTSGPVPVGVVIADYNYARLPNKQKNFSIHGVAPTETSTLYVSRNSDIFDLSKDKIITVIYEYNYEESDESGLHITPVSERHVVNIHLQFKSGIPTVEDISSPSIVLPGTSVTLRTPDVTPGAYEVTGGGWEIFENISDAESHMNGVDYSPTSDPLYWYQDGYYVAYYAQTYLGKTYSNHVPLSVANYHDLKKVMDDKKYHLHVDYDLNRMKRESKIYINDYSSSSQNGLDLLKDFYDLSLLNKSSSGVTDGVVTASNNLNGHALLNNHVKGCDDLEFILHSDIDHSKTAWLSIGSTECFAGNFHGDGHTISGLSNSLFDKLCGNVYNLGVTGTFTGAGVAESGSGYVENCWISTSSTGARTSSPVFGSPTIEANTQRPYRIVNCYYQEDDNATNKYTNHSGGYGIPTRKDAKAFYNGEVAYDLNGFYLYKRYSDQKVTSGNPYYCFHMETQTNGTQELELKTKYYGNYDAATTPLCSFGYVENRYQEGDFRFAEGSIPNSEEKRAYTVTDTNNNEVTRYAPIWPDDYLFFGQSLTYDYGSAHQSQPSVIKKSAGSLMDGEASNRVYRAPAYYGSATMGLAHFNPVAILASSSNPEAGTPVIEAYPGMTAIDFAGHGDALKGKTSYKLGYNDATHFYEPLLDDGGLYSIENVDETHNLLVYAPAKTAENAGDYANQATFDVLKNYFTEPAYSSCAINDGYGSVAIVTTPVFGHLVQSNLKTTTDHLLVDKQDFDCPISYSMGGDYRMWYQRTPDKFVTLESGETKGWDVVSLPFVVQKVATQQKGEISHFYTTSTTGHEYWLREFAGNVKQKKDQNGADIAGVFTADFNSIDASSAANTYNYTNRFLWDYYYSKNPNGNVFGDDKNGDDYKEYYHSDHSFTNYPLQQAGTAYLVGSPGASYYEFDLSGQWTAQNTASTAPAKLDKQTITFVSATGVGIGVSDNEKEGTAINGNKFQPNYLTKKLTENDYLLNSDGNSFDKAGSSTTVPFRPYLYVVKTDASGTRGGNRKDSINSVVFGGDVPQMKVPKANNQLGNDDALIVTAGKKKICVESQLHYTTDVRIVTPAGITLTSYSIQSSEYVETHVESAGVYIVYADNGKYVKKVIVK